MKKRKYIKTFENKTSESIIPDSEIKKASDKAYKKAGHNAYFGNGFEAGVKFALEYMDKYNDSISKK